VDSYGIAMNNENECRSSDVSIWLIASLGYSYPVLLHSLLLVLDASKTLELQSLMVLAAWSTITVPALLDAM
jgi:hypothetical protein